MAFENSGMDTLTPRHQRAPSEDLMDLGDGSAFGVTPAPRQSVPFDALEPSLLDVMDLGDGSAFAVTPAPHQTVPFDAPQPSLLDTDVPPSRSRFITLPDTVRKRIYGYLLLHKYAVVELDKEERLAGTAGRRGMPETYKRYSFRLDIFRVNKQISTESRMLFYRKNKFVSVRSSPARYITNATAYLPIITRTLPDGVMPYVLDFGLSVKHQRSTSSNDHPTTIILVAKDLPVMLGRLRAAIICLPKSAEVTVDLNLTPPSPWNPSSEESVAHLLKLFTRLVRVHNVFLTGQINQDLQSRLLSNMKSQPPIGEEVVAELRRLKGRGKNLMQANNLFEAEGVFRHGRKILSVMESDYMSVQETSQLGDPEVLTSLRSLCINYDRHIISACCLRDSFVEASQLGEDAKSAIASGVPEYTSRKIAKLHFELAKLYMRWGNLRAEHLEDWSEIVEDLIEALGYADKACEIDPRDGFFSHLRDLIRSRLQGYLKGR
ncbi:hypothetical protein MMC13_002148 [Lambiella insularis]|nr:hypothetical protein [Lambiella insularis]